MSKTRNQERVNEQPATLEVPANPEQPAPAPAKSKLTKEQQDELAGLEQTIEKGQGSFVEIGMALKAIEEKKLYKTASKIQFPKYCRSRWDMSKAYAYRLIHAAEFVEKLRKLDGEDAIKVFPVRESQVRPIVERLKANQWVSAWRQVLKAVGGGVITAAIVSKVVREKLEKSNDQDAADTNAAPQQAAPNDPLQKIVQLVQEARSKTDGLTIDFYKQTLDKIWGELEPQLKAA